ncbi:SDR family oxidoreductase [Alphaproteobacteria bacterium HT1-32]|nr:SDR family oxidoreductase [Alphaproteobacteria bacterium HT1-32]
MDRVVLITGASSGIGAAVCRRVAAPGTSLMLHARGGKNGEKKDNLLAIAEAARQAGAEAETVFCDLETPGSASALSAMTVERFGRIDQIVSNAGFALRQDIGEVTRQDLDRSLQGMAGAFFDLMSESYESLRTSERGRVVAVSSFVAHVFKAGQLFPVTAAAKGAIEAMAKSLATQLAPFGSTVNCVAPGYTRKEATGHSALSSSAWDTAADLTPMKRIADPDDIAATVAFLLSDDAKHITGQTIHVDGGLTLG